MQGMSFLAMDKLLRSDCDPYRVESGIRYLKVLSRAGEVATPRSYEELRRILNENVEGRIETRREGSMAFIAIARDS
jgi:hypothetical protein